MKESFVIFVTYQEQEYGEVEENAERMKYRMEEWIEHQIPVEDMEIVHIQNHKVTRYNGKVFLKNF